MGYGFKSGSQSLPYFNFTNYTANVTSVSEQQLFVSLGKGTNFGLATGMMINEHIGTEIEFQFFNGSDLTSTGNYTGGKESLTISSNMFKIIPSLILSTNLGSLKPYGKFGIVFGFGSFDTIYNDVQGTDELNVITEFTGGSSIGLNAGLGFLIRLSDLLSIATEINLTNLSYSPKEGNVVKADLNGDNILNDISIRSKEIIFVERAQYNITSEPLEFEPMEAFKQNVPFGSLSFDIGLKIDL